MSIGSAVFAQRTGRRVSHYFKMNCYNIPKKLPLPLGGSGPTSNTWYLGPTRVIKPHGIWIGSAIFVWVPNVMLFNALSMGKKTSKIAPGNMQKNLVKIAHVIREICSRAYTTRWLYCVEWTQYSNRLEALGYLCDCLCGRPKITTGESNLTLGARRCRQMVQCNSTGDWRQCVPCQDQRQLTIYWITQSAPIFIQITSLLAEL